MPIEKPEHWLVLCPKCGNLVLSRWVVLDGVGGIEPVECPCGYMILVESEAEHRPVGVAA